MEITNESENTYQLNYPDGTVVDIAAGGVVPVKNNDPTGCYITFNGMPVSRWGVCRCGGKCLPGLITWFPENVSRRVDNIYTTKGDSLLIMAN